MTTSTTVKTRDLSDWRVGSTFRIPGAPGQETNTFLWGHPSTQARRLRTAVGSLAENVAIASRTAYRSFQEAQFPRISDEPVAASEATFTLVTRGLAAWRGGGHHSRLISFRAFPEELFLSESPTGPSSFAFYPIRVLNSQRFALLRSFTALLRESAGSYVASYLEGNVNTSGETPAEALDNLKSLIIELYEDYRGSSPFFPVKAF
jgi:predicted RNase H-like HicB family nuclease